MSKEEVARSLSSSTLAGVFISLGASAALAAPNKSVGALIFTLGLTAVLTFRVDLFTGKCGYLLTERYKKQYLAYLARVWLGNLFGCICVAAILKGTTIDNGFLLTYQDKLTELVRVKGAGTAITSILCGALMYIAVDGFKRQSKTNPMLGCICYISAVAAFVMCGYEHCVACMFYFVLAGMSWSNLIFLGIVTLGNMIGSSFIHLLLTQLEKPQA